MKQGDSFFDLTRRKVFVTVKNKLANHDGMTLKSMFIEQTSLKRDRKNDPDLFSISSICTQFLQFICVNVGPQNECTERESIKRIDIVLFVKQNDGDGVVNEL